MPPHRQTRSDPKSDPDLNKIISDLCTTLPEATSLVRSLKDSVVDPKIFFSEPDPTFQEIFDLDPIPDPT